MEHVSFPVGNYRTSRTSIDWIAGALVITGGLNWAMVGLLRFNLVAAAFGPMSLVTRIIYDIVGLAAVYRIIRALVPRGQMQVIQR